MVAVVSGNALGLSLGSMADLGQRGVVGQSAQGRSGEQVYVNATTGNLVVQRSDEYLASRGLDIAMLRTYNSRGLGTDDNGDNWQLGVYKKLDLSGKTKSGGVLKRTDGDGATASYQYNTARKLYITTEGEGAHDTLEAKGKNWLWTDGATGATETYDANGRLLSAQDIDGNVTTYGYNTAGLIRQVTGAGGDSVTLDYVGNKLMSLTTRYTDSDGVHSHMRTHYRYDAVGNLLTTTSYAFGAGGGSTESSTAWQAIGDIDRQVKQESHTQAGSHGHVLHTYDGAGALERLWHSYESAGNPDRRFFNDLEGRVLQMRHLNRDGTTKSGAGTKENFAIVRGEQLARTADNTIEATYKDEFGQVSAFTGQASVPRQATGAKTYVVQHGDTLQKIAQAVYGDANLWYAIAEANGLTNSAAYDEVNNPMGIRAGQTLTLPDPAAIGAGTRNSATTLRPYDPTQAIGDTGPNMPPPPVKKHSFFKKLLAAFIQMVVTFFAGPLAGSIFGQAASYSLGLQDSFSWESVALSAISSGVSQGLPADFGSSLGATGQLIVKAAVVNAITQGIGVATGLQDRFSWRSVAASAVGAGVGQVVGDALGLTPEGIKDVSPGELLGKRFVAGLAAGAAAAIARGGKVAVLQVATDAFGNALGQSIADAATGDPTSAMGAGPSGVRQIDGSVTSEAENLRRVRASQDAWTVADNLYLDPWVPRADVYASRGAAARAAVSSDFRTSERQFRTDYETYYGNGSDGGLGGLEGFMADVGAAMRLGLDSPVVRAGLEGSRRDVYAPDYGDALSAMNGGTPPAPRGDSQVGRALNWLGTPIESIRSFKDVGAAPALRTLNEMEALSNSPDSGFLTRLGANMTKGYLGWAAGGIEAYVPDSPLGLGLTALSLPAGARAGLNLFDELRAAGNSSTTAKVAMEAPQLAAHLQAEVNGFKGVKVTPNGGPTFAKTEYLYPVEANQRNIVEITMTGSRRLDFDEANRLANLTDVVPKGSNAPRGYVWHHVDDFDPNTGRTTLELVRLDAHTAIPHAGSVRQYEVYYRTTYKK